MPQIKTYLRDIKVVAPQPATFTCDLEPGDPKAKIHWYKEAKEIYPSKKYDMSFEDGTAKLVISPSELNDSATYRLEAENKLARVDTQGKLTVQGQLQVLYLRKK